MPNLSTPQSAFQGSNPFLEVDIPDSEEIYEPTPFGIAAITNVDRLLDEVFQGVEQMLERGSVLPSDLHEPAAYLQAEAAPLLMPACLTPPPTSATAYLAAAALSNAAQLPAYLPTSAADQSVPSLLNGHSQNQVSDDELFNDLDLEELLVINETAAKPRKSGGGILLSAVVATLILTGSLFAIFKFRLYQMIPGAAPGTSEATLPESAQAGKDQQFLDYVGRSLNRIDRTATRSGAPIAAAPSVLPEGVSTITLPPAPSLITVPSSSTSAQPVFGAFTNPPVTQPTAVNPPGVVGTVAAAPTRLSSASTARPTAPRPAPRLATAQSTAPSLPAIVPPSPVVTALTPNVDLSETHALIGLLELGDRSAALLEVNGVPQRIQVGEKIGGSGWQVMSISNQAAIIQRNGEVRSIYVGQQF
jgi:hypothetical protein